MENLIEKLQVLNASQPEITQYFVKIGDEEIPVEKAGGKTGEIIVKTFNRKDEILQVLIDKKRMNIEDFQTLCDTFENTLETLWNDSGYKFKKDNLGTAKFIIENFKLKLDIPKEKDEK